MTEFLGMSLSGTSTGAASLMTGLVATEEKVLGTGHLFLPANTLRDTGEIIFEFSGLNTTATAANTFQFQLYHDSVPAVITAGASSGTAIFTQPTISVVNAAWDESDKAIILTGGFSAYTFMRGDSFLPTAGVATLAATLVTAKTSNNEIRVTDDINAAGGDVANGVDGILTTGTLPTFGWTTSATDAWRMRVSIAINRMATTTSNFSVLTEMWVNPFFSDGLAGETDYFASLKGGTLSPNVATLTADQYLWFTIKSSVTAAAFTCTHARAIVNGRSQGLVIPGAQ